MSNKTIGSIPQIAQTLVDHLPKEMDDQLKSLIAAAERGQDTTVEIIDLFAQYEITRDWLEKQVVSSSRKDRSEAGYRGLAGDPVFVPPTQKWICPENERDHWMFVMQEGEDAPVCKVHSIKMVRGSKGKG